MKEPGIDSTNYSVDSAISRPDVSMLWQAGRLSGAPVQRSQKTLDKIRGLFANGASCELPGEELIYSVDIYAQGEGEGALSFGSTTLYPGIVGQEYFMTHGHFHRNATRSEFYFPTAGRGLLLRMERSGKTWAEEMLPGAVHFIDGAHAHRVVNTGEEPLVFWACWSTDSGYDYDSIVRDGFGLRVMQDAGRPTLLPVEKRGAS